MGLLEKAFKYKRTPDNTEDNSLEETAESAPHFSEDDAAGEDLSGFEIINQDDSDRDESSADMPAAAENNGTVENIKNSPVEYNETIASAAYEEEETPATTEAESYDKETVLPEKKRDDDYEELNELKFNDFMLLYEIQKEITRASSTEELYDVILFSLMGQIGASSSSIMVRDPKNVNRWRIVESRGVVIENEDLVFDPSSGILGIMFDKKEIIDIDDYKNDPQLIDDYYKYISIDVKLLVPLKQNYEILGTVLLGEKVSQEEYTEEDKEFLDFIGEVSAIALNNISTMEMIMKVNENLSKDFSYIRDVDRFEERILHNISLKKIEADIQDEFNKMGIRIFSLYIKNPDDRSFYPIFAEAEDFLSMKESNIKFKDNSDFIRFINKADIPVFIDNFKNSDLVTGTFTVDQTDKMVLFRIYPFGIGNNILGFIIINKIGESAVLEEIDKKMKRITGFIFSHIQNMIEIEKRHSSYIDNIEIVFNRIREELKNSQNLEIPLTLVLLSIKNYKRYYNLFGYKAFEKLFDKFEEIIRSRLSDNDFSIRHGRNKILIVLPGKDKKYSVPLSNTISHEMAATFNNKEFQLLITSLSAEFPEDGGDIYSLFDKID